MRLHPYTPPAVEPITLAEAKLHLRVDLDDDDDLITSLIVAARQVCEGRLRRALVTQVWDLTLCGFPECGPIRVPLPPLVSVGSVKYRDGAGVQQTLSGSVYVVAAGTPGAIHLADGQSWPTTQEHPEAVTVRFTAGYGAAAAVPDCIKAAMKLLIGHWYENREAVNVGNITSEVPMAVTALLAAEDPGTYA